MILFYFECSFKKTHLTQIWTEQKNKVESIKKNKLIKAYQIPLFY